MRWIWVIFGFMGLLPTAFSQTTRVRLKQLELAPDTLHRYVVAADTVTGTAYWEDLDSLGLGTGNMSTFYLRGDAGTLSTLTDGDTIDVKTGAGLSSWGKSPDQILLTLDSTGVVEGTYNFATVTVNAQGRITLITGGVEIDGSITNEGLMGVAAGGANDATLYTNTSGNLGTTFAGGTGITVTETTAANGGTITITNAGDLSTTNEIQQIDTLSLSGTTLSASLSSDGVAAKTVNLSGLLTGYPTGSGTSGYVARWTSSSALGTGILRDDGTLLSSGGVSVTGYSFYDYATGAWRLPVGTTAQQPTGQAGALRYNSSVGLINWHNGAAWAYLAPSAGAFTTGSIPFANSSGQLTQDNSNFYFDDTNNRLGIGTTSPSYPVHVTGSNAGAFAIYLKNTSSGSGAAANFIIENDVSGRSGQIFKAGTAYGTFKTITNNDFGIYNGNSGNMSFLNDNATGNMTFTTGGGATAQLTLSSSGYLTLASPGRLGIGTTSPSYPVHVTGSNAGAFAVYLKNTSSGSGAAANFIIENDVSGRSGQIFKAGTAYGTYKTITNNDFGIYNGNSGNMSFLNDNATGNMTFTTGGGATAQLTLSSAGFLGIGTTSPAYALDISSTGGMRLPVGTTAQRPTGAAGVFRYNSSTPGLEYYNGSTWVAVGPGSGTMSSWTLAGTSGTPQTVSDGQTATVAAGYGMTTTAAATRMVTVAADSTKLATQYDLTQIPTIYTADGTLTTDRLITIDETTGGFNLFLDDAGDTKAFTFGKGGGTYSGQDGLWYEDYVGSYYSEALFSADAQQNYIAAGQGLHSQAFDQSNNATFLKASYSTSEARLTLSTLSTSNVYARLAGTHQVEFEVGATGKFFWDVNNVEKMTFTSGADLGIGDTSPEGKLDVNGVTKTNQIVGQGNNPSIATNANAGTGRSAGLTTAQSSDLAGRGYITSGTTLTAGEWFTMTWGTAYSVVPVVQLMCENANCASIAPYLYVVPTTTGVSVGVNVTGASYESKTYEFNYIVIGGK